MQRLKTFLQQFQPIFGNALREKVHEKLHGVSLTAPLGNILHIRQETGIRQAGSTLF